MHYITRSFFGHTDPNSWSQFWENEPDNPQILTTRGHLFGLVNLSLNEDEDASAIGHELISQINTQYYQSSPVNLQNWLIDTVNSVGSAYLSQCSELSLVVAINLNQHLYLVSFNSGQAIFQRDTQISTILKPLSGKTSFVTGPVDDNDQLFLSTLAFSQYFTWENIKKNLSVGKIQETEENFLSQLYSLPDQSHLAAVLVQFHEDTAASIPEIVAEETTDPEPTAPLPTQKTLFTKLFSSRGSFVPHLESASANRRHRFNIIFSLIILFALGASIFYSASRNRQSQLETKYQSLKSQFEAKMQNANAVKNVSLSDAQKLAAESADILKSMSALKIHTTEIATLQSSTQTLLSQTGSSSAYQPVNFYDTTLISKTAQYSQLSLFQNNLYLFDSVNGRIDKIDITNKSKQTIATLDSLKGAQNFTVDNDNVYILKDLQIYQVSSASLVSKIPKISSPGPIHFWNGSLYLLNDTIWKFTPNSKGFDSGVVWLKSGESLPTNPSSIAINGQVWIISTSGTIVPYTHGAHTQFTTKTNGTAISHANNLVTGGDSDILAFTDADNLVYVYKKTGESLFNYNFSSKKILSLAFDQTSNTIFVLCSDAQIYKIAL